MEIIEEILLEELVFKQIIDGRRTLWNYIYSDLLAIARLTGCSGDEKISLDAAAFNYLAVYALTNWMSSFIYMI